MANKRPIPVITVLLTPQQVRDMIELLGYNVTIPEAVVAVYGTAIDRDQLAKHVMGPIRRAFIEAERGAAAANVPVAYPPSFWRPSRSTTRVTAELPDGVVGRVNAGRFEEIET